MPNRTSVTGASKNLNYLPLLKGPSQFGVSLEYAYTHGFGGFYAVNKYITRQFCLTPLKAEDVRPQFDGAVIRSLFYISYCYGSCGVTKMRLFPKRSIFRPIGCNHGCVHRMAIDERRQPLSTFSEPWYIGLDSQMQTASSPSQ